MDKRNILEEIRRTTEDNHGEPLGVARFLSRPVSGKRTGTASFGRGEATPCERPDMSQSNSTRQSTTGRLSRNLFPSCANWGDFQVRGELKIKAHTDKQFPTHNVFARLGSKQQLAKKILSYCTERTGYDDMAGLCAPQRKTFRILKTLRPTRLLLSASFTS